MRDFFRIILHELGFDSFSHLFRSVFGLKGALFAFVQVSATSLAIAASFIKEWVWDPPSGAVVFGILVLVESLMGTYVAITIRKEKFNFRKFYNIAPKFLAHIGLLALAYNMGRHSVLLIWLPNACFAWFASRNFLAIVLDMIQLRLVKGEFADFLKRKFEIEDAELAETIKNDLER